MLLIMVLLRKHQEKWRIEALVLTNSWLETCLCKNNYVKITRGYQGNKLSLGSSEKNTPNDRSSNLGSELLEPNHAMVYQVTNHELTRSETEHEDIEKIGTQEPNVPWIS